MGIFQDFENRPQWVCYKLVQRGDKLTKQPKNPHTGYNAKSNDPQTWGTYKEAAAGAERFKLDGVGVMLVNGLIGIDLDHVVNDNGEIMGFASDIVNTLDSYTEYSPSGTGLHILCTGALDRSGKQTLPQFGDNVALEMYQSKIDSNGDISGGRFFTVTGAHYGEPKPIQERTQQAATVQKRYFSEVLDRIQNSTAPAPSVGTPEQNDFSDSGILTLMLKSKNGAKIQALWQGDTSAHGGDHSAATLALVNHLAYWTNGDAERIDRLFRQSGLYANMKTERGGLKKWDVKHVGGLTFGEATIAQALRDFVPYAKRDERREEQREEQPTQSIAEFETDFYTWIDADITTKIIPCGISEIDSMNGGGIPIGLSVLMGETSVGKTAIALNMAENIAESGKTVLFFSTEMPRNTCIARGISRKSKKIPYSEIITGKAKKSDYQSAAREYFTKCGKNLYFIECFGGTTPAEIERQIKQFKSPVVFIDYLQQLNTSDGKAYDERIKMKRVATDLLKVCNENNIAMLVLSSVSRDNYGKRLVIDSGKESGELEYNAACVMGIQYTAALEKDLTAKQREEEKSKAGGRRVSVTVLKNRLTDGTGKSNFIFKSACNLFESEEISIDDLEKSLEEWKKSH